MQSQNIGIQSQVKLCIPRLVENLYAAYDIDGTHFLDNVDVNGIMLKENFKQHSFHYLLGLLNSSLLRWFFPKVSVPFRGGWLSANRQFIEPLPIPTINFKNPKEKALHDKMVSLVDNMLKLNIKLKKTKTPHEKELLERQLKITDNQIDRLVYELYGLTEEEIGVVEGK